MIPISQLEQLPLTHRQQIPPEYQDEMGHMNIQFYVYMYGLAAWSLFGLFGITLDHVKARHEGMFALKQFIHYRAEVHIGETVQIRSRVLGVSARRIHYLHFMINESTGKLASTFEVLASYADLDARRTAPFPDDIRATIEDILARHQQLDWEAPVCGILEA